MESLCQDVQIQILSFLIVSDIMSLHISCSQFEFMINDLVEHEGFVIESQCKLNDKEIDWLFYRDINFTDEQGNEFFVKVRDEKVVVFKNKTEIKDVRFYVDELTEE